MLEARQVSISLSGRTIVRDARINVAPGRLTIVIGPNGSGKTTLLRALSGELEASGEVRLNGQPINTMKPWQAAELRAVLPQSTTLSFPFTVREIVALGLSESGHATAQHDLPEAALARVDLAGFGGRLYQDLSGGEQQRVQLARVLCQVPEPVRDGTPHYLLLDEPVSSLDIKHQLAIMQVARGFADAGGGVFAVLHDLNLASMFADEIVAMRDGRIVAQGAPAEVLDDSMVASVFGVPLQVGVAPPDRPFILPQSWTAVPQNPARGLL